MTIKFQYLYTGWIELSSGRDGCIRYQYLYIGWIGKSNLGGKEMEKYQYLYIGWIA